MTARRLGAFAALAACGLVAVQSFDTPWLLRAGRLIVESGALPAADPCSYTATRPWLHHEWLAEVGLYGLHRAGGFAALVVVQGLVLAATLALVAWAARARLLALPVLLAAAVLREALEPRAALFTLPLFAATWALCLRDRERPSPALWAVLPLQLLWTQVHGGNPNGVALVGLLAITAPSWRRLAVAAAAAALTCAGPYGPRVFEHFLGARGDFPAIREWQPLRVALAAGGVSEWLAVGLVAWAAVVLVVRRRRGERVLYEAAALALFALLAWQFVRFVAEASLVAATIAARVRWRREWVGSVAGLALLATLTVVGRPPGLGLQPGRYPEPAVDWLRANRPPGPMLNSYNYGGYLLWAYPEEKVFIDGRAFTVYDPALVRDLVAVYDDPGRFDELERRFGFRLAVLQRAGRGAAFAAMLARRPGWREAWADPRTVILVKP
jgi:hypothetical protein